MKQLEHSEQVNLIKWWSLVHNNFGAPECCLFAIPNGGQRNLIVATKLKAEGIRAGVPDLFLAIPKKGFNGLFIEMKKTKGGRVSDNQKSMLSILTDNGYLTRVCHGFNEARITIEQYLRQGVDNVQNRDCRGNGEGQD